uniref:Uncharacterized protein n=1 Tax=Chromera velia CCMP2878 TaxID=1169474 RepID=A0A0G4FCR8_9ALVE|eukprot:Cvel_16394.t1-p1 / transcript=Cvel_16394.t1 / gene=Cvel_16394 / organism=Chromera_velia_CCMP2878 / gene_product=hypothetical protein / transcript_product=hypothetical protein / location=Cvel_scaffold1262:1870-4573(+) / protein_length=219 / sequence_SO=supercontig / SO=protein_coding / is_pseudo=false
MSLTHRLRKSAVSLETLAGALHKKIDILEKVWTAEPDDSDKADGPAATSSDAAGPRAAASAAAAVAASGPGPSAPSRDVRAKQSSQKLELMRRERDSAALNDLENLVGETREKAQKILDQLLSRHFKMDLSRLFCIDVSNTLRSFRSVSAAALVLALRNVSPEDFGTLMKVGADLEEKVHGKTVLMHGCEIGRLERVEAIVDDGADVNAQIEASGDTPS